MLAPSARGELDPHVLWLTDCVEHLVCLLCCRCGPQTAVGIAVEYTPSKLKDLDAVERDVLAKRLYAEKMAAERAGLRH